MVDITGVFVAGFNVTNNARFVVGLPSIGNVGQLAVDCLLCTLNQAKILRYAGCLESQYILPMTGYEKLGSRDQPRLCMPIEVYEVVNHNLYIIQQRSLCMKGTQQRFSQSLLRWLQSVNFECAVVLTGASTEEIELQNNKIFHISSAEQSKNPALASLLEGTIGISVSSHSVQQNVPFTFEANVEIDDMMNMTDLNRGFDSSYPLGMTTAKYLLDASLANDSNNDKVVVVGKYISEGDNVVDGLELALRVLNNFIYSDNVAKKITMNALVHPESWRRCFGGSIRDSNMFN